MIEEMFQLKDYCSVVTGAAQGLGKSMAMALGKYGSNIIIADLNINLAKKTAKELGKRGIKAIAVEMDVREEEQIEKMIGIALDKFGKIDVLINNAGICKHINAEEMRFEDWKEVIDINLNGVFKTTKADGPTIFTRSTSSTNSVNIV